MSSSKYKDTVKVEFKSLIDNIVNSSRKSFHLYTIHRVLSLGLLIDFTFHYVQVDNSKERIGIELDLKNHGVALFIVDIETSYVKVSEESVDILNSFLKSFGTCLVKKKRKKGRKIF